MLTTISRFVSFSIVDFCTEKHELSSTKILKRLSAKTIFLFIMHCYDFIMPSLFREKKIGDVIMLSYHSYSFPLFMHRDIIRMKYMEHAWCRCMVVAAVAATTLWAIAYAQGRSVISRSKANERIIYPKN